MIPPNLKSVVIPCCCGNCHHWNDSITWCRKYTYDTEIEQVCDSWESIEYGN